MKPFAYFLCALVILLIAISPWLILSYYEKLPQEESYQGILSMWHITDWRTGGSSTAAFLENRIKQYEAQHPHIFIELQCYSAEESAAALQSGQKPDIISYPYGLEPVLVLASLPDQNLIFLEHMDTAYPYMCGGYCLLVNTDMLSDNGVDLYVGWGIRPDALLEAASLGVVFDSEQGYSALPSLALHVYPPAERPNISTWGEPEMPDAALGLEAAFSGGLDAFCNNEAAVLIASHRQLFEAALRYEQGEGPAFAAYAIGGYTDMAQLVSISIQEDVRRQAACADFAGYLVNPNTQKKLEALGVFPVVCGIDIYRENESQRAIYDRLCESGVLAAPEERQTLDALAKEAFGGSVSALKKLRSRLDALS
jgi:hypothetical protein